MSLKVWLPLDGDLRNLGASDIEVTNNGATIDNNGKIGKCMKIIEQKELSYTPNFNNNSYSFGGWFKFNKDEINTILQTKTYSSRAIAATGNLIGNTSYGGFGLIWTSNNMYSSNKTFSSLSIFSTLRTATVDQSTSGFIVDFDTWTHIIFTWNNINKTLSLYKNGSLVNQKTIGTFTDGVSRSLKINYQAIYGGNGPSASIPFRLNDIRIYDHALSPLEIKGISRGLVLHYKFDQNYGLTDIILNQNTYTVYNNYSSSGTTGTITNLSETYQGSVVRRETMTPNDSSVSNFRSALGSHGVYGHRQTFLANTKYVFWIYYRPVSHFDIRVGGTASNIGGWTEIPPKDMGNGWYRVGQYRNGTVTADRTDNIFTSFYTPTAASGVPITIDWASPHLLMGTTEIPNSNFFMETEVKDNSGYGHNGTIIGDLIFNNETSRYTSSTKWNSSSPTDNTETGICYIQTPITLTTPLQLTVTWWAKPESGYGGGTSHAAFCTSNSTSRPTDYNTTAFHHRDSGFDIYPSDGSGVKRLSFTYVKDEWHHYAITYDGTTAKSYKDGVLQTTVTVGTNKTLASFSQLFIGYSQAGGVRRKTLGSYSDFRIYCTPLLDTDIKLLYNIGMRVDNLGGVHSFELNENQTNLMWRPENARAAGLGINWAEGLGAYTQSNCQVTCNTNGYRIYRPPNLTVANNGNTMWGGLRIRNSTNSSVHTYNASTDNIFGLIKGHTYIFVITVEGQSTNNFTSIGITNNMGWGGGGLVPSPSNVSYKLIGTNFNGKTECYYKFTVSDDIVKTCTSSYSSFTSGNQYLSYMDFMFGFGYESTGSLGTDLYISNIRLFDITTKTSKNIMKSGIINFTQFVEKEENITKIREDEELYSTEFIEI